MTIDRREFLGVAGASILAPLMGGDETIAPQLEATEPAPHDAEITDVRSVRRPSNDLTNSFYASNRAPLEREYFIKLPRNEHHARRLVAAPARVAARWAHGTPR